MTKSEHPQGDGGFFAQQQQQQQMHDPRQQVPPAQAEQAPYHPGAQQYAPTAAGAGMPHDQVAVGHGQSQAGQPLSPQPLSHQPLSSQPQSSQPLSPMQQQVGQLPPPAASHETYGEYAAPQQGQHPVAGGEQLMVPSYEAPMDDYQYPQGQAVLQDVPPVAVPPAGRAPADPMMQAQQPLNPGIGMAQQQATDTGFGEAAAISSAGEQISQRLAQLQNQYDEEVSGDSWGEAPTANTATHQPADQFAAQQPVSEDYAGYAPEPYGATDHGAPGQQLSPNEQFVQREELAAQNYQEQSAQTYQQSQQAYQEPAQAQQYAPPPMAAPQGSFEYTGPTPDSSHQQFGTEPSRFTEGSSIQQEVSAGGGMKKMMFGGAFVAALAVGGGAAYTYQYTDLFGSRSASGPAPTIKAASSPVKFLKKKIEGAGDSINRAMHNRLSGADGTKNTGLPGGDLDRIAELGRNAVKMTGSGISAARNGMLAEAGRKTPGSATGTNMPRRVKTLIVRPDGTILRPAGNSPDKPSGLIGTGSAIVPKAGRFNTAGNNGIRRMKTIGEASSARILGGNAITPVVKTVRPIPKIQVVKKTAPQKPVIKKLAVAKKPTVVANAAPVQNLGAVGTPFVVQVTSRSSQTSALAAFADMQQKYPNLIGTYQPDIQRANLGSKGVWYRLRVGPVGSKVAASDLCNSLKQAGHPGCFVRRK